MKKVFKEPNYLKFCEKYDVILQRHQTFPALLKCPLGFDI